MIDEGWSHRNGQIKFSAISLRLSFLCLKYDNNGTKSSFRREPLAGHVRGEVIHVDARSHHEIKEAQEPKLESAALQLMMIILSSKALHSTL
jgi:hypothetical protein